MNTEKGWLIIEESVHNDTKTLISIISPRRTGSYVQKYMEQMYVDRFASIEEKIAYKKKPASWPYRANMPNNYSGIIDCGHDPIMMAYYCHKINLKNGVLKYTFRTSKGQSTDLRPIFEEITRIMVV
ncbi:MAG: hypothetical protein NTU74_16050 [Deltaproteobacteria bacterium]|nr:hypothetical protein [Deltaproteobacteria bacterium]